MATSTTSLGLNRVVNDNIDISKSAMKSYESIATKRIFLCLKSLTLSLTM